MSRVDPTLIFSDWMSMYQQSRPLTLKEKRNKIAGNISTDKPINGKRECSQIQKYRVGQCQTYFRQRAMRDVLNQPPSQIFRE